MTCCLLCRYSGGTNAMVNEVNQYISQNITLLDVDEIAKQAADMLSAVLEQECSPEMMRTHIHEHTLEPRIVVSLLLRDVRKTCETVRKTSSYEDDIGNLVIDKNTLMLYLKTVEVAAGLATRLG